MRMNMLFMIFLFKDIIENNVLNVQFKLSEWKL